MTSSTLEVRDLGFAYPDGHEALSGVDLTAEAGERIALLGPNGAGKTTFVQHLNGIHRPQTGSITVTGLTLDDEHLGEVRRRVGLVFQDPDDMLFMPTVREDVAFGPANLGLEGDELAARVEAALSSVEALPLADRAPHHLSGGEKRRCALAAVLAMEPDVLVLDEPTSGLDPASRRELIGLLDTLPQTQLVVTHDLPFALELCERTVIMSQGRIVADGPTRDLLADEQLLSANRLELPLGFDPTAVAPPGEVVDPSETHRREVDGGIGVWRVSRLWRLARDLPVRSLPVSELREEYERDYWFGDARQPTVQAVVEHGRRVQSADLRHPIILSASGTVMDGMHRLAKAHLLGRPTIDAVRFEQDPEPDEVRPIRATPDGPRGAGSR